MRARHSRQPSSSWRWSSRQEPSRSRSARAPVIRRAAARLRCARPSPACNSIPPTISTGGRQRATGGCCARALDSRWRPSIIRTVRTSRPFRRQCCARAKASGRRRSTVSGCGADWHRAIPGGLAPASDATPVAVDARHAPFATEAMRMPLSGNLACPIPIRLMQAKQTPQAREDACLEPPHETATPSGAATWRRIFPAAGRPADGGPPRRRDRPPQYRDAAGFPTADKGLDARRTGIPGGFLAVTAIFTGLIRRRQIDVAATLGILSARPSCAKPS